MAEEAGRSEKQEEVAERKPAEEEAGPSEKQEEVADRKPVEDQEAGPSTEKGCFDFDVFISFRGEDTRKRFTSHLYKELAETRGITTFIDNKNLNKGEKISVLFERIEGSKIFVPIFSQHYAGSKWCLREITKMVEINKREAGKRPIIPIFYDVDPSDVRHYRKSFGIAFKKHQKNKQLGEEEINEWKTALKAAGELSGYDLSKDERTEAEIITDIGNMVSHMLRKVPFHIQPVGIASCMDTLKQMLKKEKDGVQMIGICGMGGIGKTTLAMALYNQLFLIFEISCFLSDIREHEQREGLPSLQVKLMNEVAFGGNMTVGNIEQGVSLIKQMYGSKKVLLILDDVDHIDQLKAFTAKRGEKEELFGVGSRIIVTTRDKEVLLQHGMQEGDIYFLEGLNKEDSLQLFCHHAFDNDQPLVGFHKLSDKVVEVAQGLPLALKEFGSHFHGSKDKQEWEEKLKKMKSEQLKKIRDRLRISYDGLDDSEQRVFLDIACFFIGMVKKYPVYMWDACKYSPNPTLDALQRKSLIKVNKNDEFEMHDQIRDMGRMIVEENGKKNPLKYCRPWSGDQLLEVLNDAKESLKNRHVEGLDFTKVRNEKMDMKWKVEWRMPLLRMITGANDNEDIIHLPSNIRWLDWKSCPHDTLTFNNNWPHRQLRVLDLSNGNFNNFGLRSMAFPNLKVLDLSRCLHLIRAPDFTRFPSLEKLVLDECCSLTEMNESIGHLQKLVKLSMVGCKKLTELPIGLCKLALLESLILSGCKQISVLPTQMGDLRSLKYLGLNGTSISALPNSFGSLQSLKILDLTCCFSLEKVPDSICGLKRLSDLLLQHCELLERLRNSIGMQTSEIDCYKIFNKGRIEEKSLIYVRLK